MDAFFGLPTDVKFCKRCVVSNQRPSTAVESKSLSKKVTIEFDEEGICSACRLHEAKDHVIDWRVREEALLRLLDKHRSRDGSYDVVVPGSGGKDSIYVANELKTRYGMTPLTVTWPPHLYTDIGWRNFNAWLAMGFANVTLTANREFHRQMTKEAFLNLCHPFQPFILGQKTIGPRIGLDWNIPLVMYGESQAEGGSDIQQAMKPTMPIRYFASEIQSLKTFRLGGVSYNEWRERGVSTSDLNLYLPLNKDHAERHQLEVHHYGYYHRWRPQDCYYYAVEKSQFKANPERTEGTFSKYSSLDDKIDGFHYFTTYIKFGIGRATYEAAQEIRNHHISREEGVILVHKYDGEFPQKYFREFLDYCRIEEKLFWEVIDKNRSPHLWAQEKGKWQLRSRVR
jgi:N-acetyl sugar amidotransferase